MTLKSPEPARTETGEEQGWYSTSITVEPLSEEFRDIDVSEWFSGSRLSQQGEVATTLQIRDYVTEKIAGSPFISSGGVRYRIAPFLDGGRIDLTTAPVTVVFFGQESEASRAVGSNLVVQAIRPESDERYAVVPPARDATSVALVAPERTDFVDSDLRKIIRDSATEIFFDGMESVFTNELRRLLYFYGPLAVRAIGNVVKSGDANSETVGEILKVLGSDENPVTYGDRVALMLAGLQSSDPSIRDAASLGIASLDDPGLLEEVLAAVEREAMPQLRRNLELVADQLRLTEWQGS